MEKTVLEPVYRMDHVCSIVPPHLLEGIINAGSAHPETLDAIRRTITHTQNSRHAREAKVDELRHKWAETGGRPDIPMPDRRAFPGVPSFHPPQGGSSHDGQGSSGPPHGMPASGAPGSGGHGSSIVPPYLLAGIAKSEANAPSTRQAAQRTLDMTEEQKQLQVAPAAQAGDEMGKPETAEPEASDQEASATAGSSTNSFKQTSVPPKRSKTTTTTGTPSSRRYRAVGNAKNDVLIPGEFIQWERSKECEDPLAIRVFQDLGLTWSFLWDQFQRNSIRDAGDDLWGSVHCGSSYCNAMWNGSQMVFGDGDGKLFNDFASNTEVTAHEMAHAVISSTGALPYVKQSGALNESIADCIGLMVKHKGLNQTRDEADWLIGPGLYKGDAGKALRSVKAPGYAYDDAKLGGKDPQPDHMSKYQDKPETSDHGGVHLNSGIPNKAFYNVTVALGDDGLHSWELPGLIWYSALIDPDLLKGAEFVDFASLTVKHALRLKDEKAQSQVAQAWMDVGITPAM